ncbi:GNAT family N-acetyltransferase [Paenibacillus sp. WLX1005]|uniref:GNAT family N-acetyltransferase n=1 Tax=Paenibacillus sp. WLX1005 TaxID=3243766 RepID=UPI003983E46B
MDMQDNEEHNGTYTLADPIPEYVETERLLIRSPLIGRVEIHDSVIVNAAIRESLDELMLFLPFAQRVPELLDTEIDLQQARLRFLRREGFRYLIFSKESAQFIGVVSLQGIDYQVKKCELGYWIRSSCSGHGYMAEAVEALIELGFERLGFRRMAIQCESTNWKSRALAERLGFELEGILKNEDLSADGLRWTDTCIYAKVKM